MERMNAYLRDLLILHDCVILPEFGGFVGNYQTAQKSEQNYFMPPRKNIAFNPQLKDSDGLLTNTVATIEKIDYNAAATRVNQFVEQIKKELKAKGEFTIPYVGKLQNSKEERILFTPDTTSNLLASPVGLGAFCMQPILHNEELKKQPEKRAKVVAMPILRRALVASVSGFALLSLLINQGEFKNLSLASLAPIQSETRILKTIEKSDKPPHTPEGETSGSAFLKRAEKNIVKIPKNFHVIVGCFSMKENAEVQKAQLAEKGITANVFTYNNNLTAVSVGAFATFDEARVEMNKLRNSENASSAWVLKRQLK